MRRRIFFFVVMVFLIAGTGRAAAQEQDTIPGPSEEALQLWNRMAKMVIDMAAEFPEEKYDYRPTPEVRSFGEQLLHVASANYFFIDLAGGSRPERGSRETKAEIVAVLKKSYADGAALIRQTGDTGMSRPIQHPFEDRTLAMHTIWMVAVGHSGEHFGQLVVYYRLNGLVPPTSRGN